MTPYQKKILDAMFELRKLGETLTTGAIAEKVGVAREKMGHNLQTMYKNKLVTKMGLMTQWYSTKAQNKQMMWNVNMPYLRLLEKREIESAQKSFRPPKIMFEVQPKKGTKRVPDQQVRNAV